MKTGSFLYATPGAPKWYSCCICGAHGCKLWRASGSFCIELHCCECIAKEERVDISTVDAHGMFHLGDHTTDQIGGYVPAVPDEDGTWWGYTSVPNVGIMWWYRLTSRPTQKATAG